MRGRNVGLVVARGEYVYLMGQTDRLERTALERMYERAVETEADILIGRLVSDRRPPVRRSSTPTASAPTSSGTGCSSLLTAAQALPQGVPGRRGAELRRPRRTPGRAGLRASAPTCGPRSSPSWPTRSAATSSRAARAARRPLRLGRRAARTARHHRRRGPRGTPARPDVRALVPHRGAAPARRGPVRLTSARDRAATFTTLRELVVQRFPQRLDHYLPVICGPAPRCSAPGRLDQLLVLDEAMRGTRLQADLQEVLWDDGVFTMGLTVEIICRPTAPRSASSRTARTACSGSRRCPSTGSASRRTGRRRPRRLPGPAGGLHQERRHRGGLLPAR